MGLCLVYSIFAPAGSGGEGGGGVYDSRGWTQRQAKASVAIAL